MSNESRIRGLKRSEARLAAKLNTDCDLTKVQAQLDSVRYELAELCAIANEQDGAA